MFTLNLTYVIFVISFLVFMALLNEILLKPIGKVIEERQAKIKGDISAGQAAREQASTLLAKYEDDLRNVREKAQDIINKASDDASKLRSDKVSALQKKGKEALEAAKTEIQGERDRLIDELVAHEKDLVELITQKVLGEPVKVSLDASQVRRTLEGS